MPTSEHWQIPRVCDVLVALKPASVLDVGAGYGKYGLLAREFGEAGRVDAIDANPPRFPVYDHVYVGDLREIDTLLPADAPLYHLALFIDVIEHLEKAEARAFLTKLARRARRILVTTPWGFRPQEIPDMPWETHRSGWYPWDFRAFGLERWSVFPGHYSKFLRRPRLFQILALLAPRS